jgi:hypothetical protein
MRAVIRGNDAYVVHGFVEQRDVFLVLDYLDRIKTSRLIEGARNPRQMATGLGIQVQVLPTVVPLGFGFRRVFEPGWRRAASCAGSSAAPTAAPRATCGEICSIQRTDE